MLKDKKDQHDLEVMDLGNNTVVLDIFEFDTILTMDNVEKLRDFLTDTLDKQK